MMLQEEIKYLKKTAITEKEQNTFMDKRCYLAVLTLKNV